MSILHLTQRRERARGIENLIYIYMRLGQLRRRWCWFSQVMLTAKAQYRQTDRTLGNTCYTQRHARTKQKSEKRCFYYSCFFFSLSSFSRRRRMGKGLLIDVNSRAEHEMHSCGCSKHKTDICVWFISCVLFEWIVALSDFLLTLWR